METFRSSPAEVFLWKGVLKICSKFTEHPCRTAILIKLQSNFIEVALRHGSSPVNLLHICKKTFSQEHLWRGIPEFLDSGQELDAGSGSRKLDCGLWALDAGLWTSKLQDFKLSKVLEAMEINSINSSLNFPLT